MNQTDKKVQPGQNVDEAVVQSAQSVKKWGRATLYFGLGLIASIGLVIPFLYGNSLHHFWDTFGVGFVVTSMGLLIAFLFSAATTLNLRLYGADLKKIDRDFARRSGKRKSGQ
jgi:ABC-type uncharacterized transport system fused permease/ATPase subunit